MRDCCSNQQDTFGELVGVLLKNYIPVWILFAFATFFFTILKFYGKQKSTKKEKNE